MLESTMHEFISNPTYWWLLTGALLISFELMTIPGVGFLFAGLGAFTIGSLMGFDVIGSEETLKQWGIFLISSGVWAAILWRPLQNFLHKPSGGVHYQNIVGTHAKVLKPGLHGSDTGSVKWSGAHMKAEIWPDANLEEIPAGTEVVVREVSGNLLKVAPKAEGEPAVQPVQKPSSLTRHHDSDRNNDR